MATGNILAEGNTDKLKLVTVAVNPNNVPAASTITQSVTIPGVQLGDMVMVNKPTDNAGLMIGGVRVTAANTVQLSLGNPTAVDVNAGQENWLFLIMRSDASLSAF